MTAAGAAVADPKARAFLRNADPVLGRLIDARPHFRPRAWLDELPPLDAFGTLSMPAEYIETLRRSGCQLALFRPLTKATFQLRAGSVAGPLAAALELACAEPPGPVHLDLPEDVGLAPATEQVPESWTAFIVRISTLILARSAAGGTSAPDLA